MLGVLVIMAVVMGVVGALLVATAAVVGGVWTE